MSIGWRFACIISELWHCHDNRGCLQSCTIFSVTMDNGKPVRMLRRIENRSHSSLRCSKSCRLWWQKSPHLESRNRKEPLLIFPLPVAMKRWCQSSMSELNVALVLYIYTLYGFLYTSSHINYSIAIILLNFEKCTYVHKSWLQLFQLVQLLTGFFQLTMPIALTRYCGSKTRTKWMKKLRTVWRR